MELPHGVLVRSFKGPVPLAELNGALQKDAFTGFMRASLFQGSFAEGVVIYASGKPIIAFISDGKSDRPDSDQHVIESIASSDDTVIELFSLNDGQLRLALDFGRDLVIREKPQAPQTQPAPAPKPVEAPKPMPVQRQAPREKPLAMPEVRGTFVKSENAVSLRSYIESRSDETGHAVLVKQDSAGFTEYHLLLLQGKAVAAYSSAEAGDAFLAKVLAVSGVIELYRVDEAIIHSILKMYPHVALAAEPAKPEPVKEAVKAAPVVAPPEPKPMEVLRADGKPYVPLSASRPEPIARSEAMAHGTVTRAPNPPRPMENPPRPMENQPRPMETHRLDSSLKPVPGVSTKALFEKNFGTDGMGMPAPESKSTGALKGDMEDDADYVKKIEKEFVGNVDDLLKRLELSHLKVVPDKKKRT